MKKLSVTTVFHKAMGKILRISLLSLFFVFCFNLVMARNLYVDPSGDNTTGTSLATAFHTIQQAHNVSFPGDTINVANGTYDEEVVITRSGTDIAYITYKSINKWGALVTNDFYNSFTVQASYIKIDGFELIAPSTYGKGIGAKPVSPGNFVHHLIFTNNKCHDSGESGVAAQDCDYVTISNNVCYNNSWLMPWSGSGISIYGRSTFDTNAGYHYIVSGNVCYSNDNGPGTNKTDGNGIIIDDLRNTQKNHIDNGLTTDLTYTTHAVLVESNLCYANGGKGITMPWSNNITLRNNTVYGNNTRQDQGAWSGELNLPYCSNVTAINNICVGTLPLSSGIFAGAGTGIDVTSNLSFYNNIAYSTLNSANSATSENITISVCGLNGNLCNVNPLFANPGANFHLRSTSPAKNAGTSAYGLSTLDLDGFAREQGIVDIGCYETSATNVAVTSFSFNPNAITIPAATTNQPAVVVSPANATNQIVTYASSNSSIASVDENTGVISGVAMGGPVQITGTTQDGSKTATCAVTVTRANTIAITSAPTQVNALGTFTVNVNYSAGQNGFVKVMIIGPAPSYRYYGEGSIAVVTNQVGTNVSIGVTPNSPLPAGNNYNFRAVVSDDTNKEFVSTAVLFTVLPTIATGLSLSPATKTIDLASSLSLVSNFTPSYTTNQNVTWVSSNPAVAPVSSTGLVTGLAPGTATITGTTQDGSLFSSTSNITVSSIYGGNITGIITNVSTQVDLTAVGKTDWVHWGATYDRKATGGNLISNYTLVGTTPAVAFLDDTRSVIWTGGTPTATTAGDFSALFVEDINSGFSITVPAGTTTSTLYLYGGGWNSSGKLTATLSDSSSGDFVYTTALAPDVYYANFSISFRAKTNGQTLTVKWVVADDGIGNVTLQGAALENGITVTNVAVTPATASLNIGATLQLDTSFTPANASNKNVSWNSSNPAIASVDYKGLVTAVAAGGPVTITATTQDAIKTATSTITVPVPGGVGTLTGTSSVSSAAVNISTVGTTDWKHFYNNNYKGTGTNSITNAQTVPVAGGELNYANDPRAFSWTDGEAPTTTSSNNLTGKYIAGNGNGFSFTAPVTSSNSTLYVYVGGWNSAGTLTASLSNGSASNYVHTSTLNSGSYNLVYTLNFSAAQAGQTINVRWVQSQGTGNVTIQGAALAGQSTPPPSTASLTGTATFRTTASTVNLSTIGTSDWKRFFTNNTNTSKASGTMSNSINNYTAVGSVLSYTNSLRGLTWTGGTSPTVSATNNKSGLYVQGINNEFSFTVPAGNGSNTLYVYVGGWNSSGTLTASLSNSAAPDYVNTSPVYSGNFTAVYTITYNAAQAGQTISIKWKQATTTGNVTLQAAALVGTTSSLARVNQAEELVEEESSDLVSVYPNPINNTLNINFGKVVKKADVTVYDAQGRLVVRKTVENKTTFTTDVSRLARGAYYLRLNLDDKRRSSLLIKN